jgi:hypothetical protein
LTRRTLPNLAAAALLILATIARGQPATAPATMPVAVFFQPQRNLAALAQMGVSVYFGPEVEGRSSLTPDQIAQKESQWIQAVADVGGRVVLKRPPATLPAHAAGVLMTVDEPNGKGVAPAALKAESDSFRAKYPGTPIFLSLAGDKITSANFDKPAERKLYQDYAALADVLTVDWYAKNRNATRYPITLTGDAVSKLRDVGGKAVWAWIEINDQQLPAPPAPHVNRAPTPDEIKQTADDAIAKGAKGIGWFATCDSGKYGWPGSYLPLVDRAGASMQSQYDTAKAIGLSFSPPPVDPIADIRVEVKSLRAKLSEHEAVIAKLRDALATTRPTNP